MTTFTDALARVSRAAAALAAAPTDPGACAEYDFACHALDLVRSTPHPAQVAALRELLDLLEGFADNDQRARYVLNSDWGRANVRRVPVGAEREPEPRPAPPVWASTNYVPGVSGVALAAPPAAHGYGGAGEHGWAPGYCWCGAWALEAPELTAAKPCAGLTAVLGRPPRSHADALRLAYLRGVGGE